ncbi:MAG TPA: ferric reductase [Mycobacteriales bacterium]|nr:ferric reductase [Mycobacteriales bacterium]
MSTTAVTSSVLADSFSSAPLWYTTRSTAIVGFVLLTLTTVFGVAATQRALASRAWPRFATQDLHRNLSLLGLVFIGTHIVTSIVDSYVNISWWALLVPGTSHYQGRWVTFGTIAFDLLIVITVTSLLRTRMPAKLWRSIHWFSYAAWASAWFHFLKNGTDSRHHRFGLWLDLVCLVVVVAAGAIRLTTQNSPAPVRSVAAGR